MIKYADAVDKLVSNALHSAQLRSATAAPGSVMSSLGSVMGISPSPFDIGYGKALGAHAVTDTFGPLKWTGFKGILPTVALAAGGTALVKHLYDKWQNTKVENQLMSDQSLTGRYSPEEVRKTIQLISRHAPSIMKDPETAKHQVNRSLQFEGLTMKDINEMLDTEKKFQETHGVGALLSPVFAAATSLI